MLHLVDSQITRNPLAKMAAFLMTLAVTSASVDAATTATLYNGSDKNVQLFLKWTDGGETKMITMKPNQVIHCWSPNDTAKLDIRFNDDPGGPVREERFRLTTASEVRHSDAGKYSGFLNKGQGMVQLVHMKDISSKQPLHVSNVMGRVQGGVVNGSSIDGRVAGEAVGAGAAAFFSDGDPESIAAGAKAGHVIGGGMPAIKAAVESEFGMKLPF